MRLPSEPRRIRPYRRHVGKSESAVLSIADINGDGRDDLLVLHDAAQTVGYYLQDASGMQNEVLLPLPYGNRYPRRGLAVGDVNHDGFSDIVLVTDMAGLVILYGAP